MDYDNTNRGIMFLKDDKPTDKHPDFSGNLNVEGVEYWVSGWNKETRAGQGISLTIKKKEVQSQPKGSWEQQRERFAKKDEPLEDITDEIDISEIPF